MGNAAACHPPASSPAPVTPLLRHPNGLFRAPYLIPATAAAPAPSRSPPRPRAWKRLGAPFRPAASPTPHPPGPQRPRLAAPSPEPPGSAMGAASAVPLLLLLACCWAPAGANLSQDGEWGAGGARGGGDPRPRLRLGVGGRACRLCLAPGVKVASGWNTQCLSQSISVSEDRGVCRRVHPLCAPWSVSACAPGSGSRAGSTVSTWVWMS